MKALLLDVQGTSAIHAIRKISVLSTPFSPPLGLLYIGGSLEEEGHKVELFQSVAEPFFEEKVKKSLSSTDVVGLCVNTKFYSYAAEVTKTIKEIDPSIPIIIGGPHCTFHPKTALQEIPSADIGVEGEGEYVIKDIMKVLSGEKKTLSGLPGVFYRENETIRADTPHKVIKELDSLPFPARHLVDKYDYGRLNKVYLFRPPLTSMVTSRGCPYRCRFCSRLALSYKTYRQRSAENVVAEIREIQDYYKSVYIVDDNFLVDIKRVHRIMDALLEDVVDIDLLIVGARVDSADRSLYRKMKQAGVKYMEFGIESGNQDVLDFYRKNITLDQIRKAVRLSREMNFITTGNFILGAPLETEKHIEETIRFACSLPLDVVLFLSLMYMYGSDLWEGAVAQGHITEKDGYHVFADSRKHLGNFTEEELREYCQKAVKRFYLRPSFLIRQFFRSAIRKDFSLLKAGIMTNL